MPNTLVLASGVWIPSWVIYSILAVIFLGIPTLILFLVSKLGRARSSEGPTADRFRKRDWILMAVVMLLGWWVKASVDSRHYVTVMNQAAANGTEQQAWQDWHRDRPNLILHFILLAMAVGGAIMARRMQTRLGLRGTWWWLAALSTVAFIQCIAILERLWHG